MLLSWCVDSSLPKAHCGRGWSLLPPLANSARDRPIWQCAAEGLREGAGRRPCMLGWASQPEPDLVLSVDWSAEWCEGWVVRGQRRKGSFYQSRDANRAPDRRSGPRTVKAARRPQFVPTARRAPGEDWSLRSTVCRHQDIQKPSGDDKMAPYHVRARAPSHASGPLGARRWRPLRGLESPQDRPPGRGAQCAFTASHMNVTFTGWPVRVLESWDKKPY